MRRIPTFLCALLLAGGAEAAPLAAEFAGTRALGMGGAHRAVSTANDAVWMNPAGLSRTIKYALEAGYRSERPEGQIYGASVVDSQTSPLAAGVGFGYFDVGGARAVRGPLLGLALAYPIAPAVYAGTFLKWLDLGGPGPRDSAFTADVGLLAVTPAGVSAALVGYNLLETGNPHAPRAAGAGLAWDGGVPGLTLAADWYGLLGADEPGHEISAGAEYLLAQLIVLRSGYRVALEPRVDRLAFGAGIVTTAFGFDVSYQRAVRGSDEGTLAFALKLFL